MRELSTFALTVAIEWPLFAWWSKLGLRTTFVFCVLMNAATWFALAAVREQCDAPIAVLEAGVIVVEACVIVWFWSWRAPRAFMTSCGTNLASWWIGSVLLDVVWRRA